MSAEGKGAAWTVYRFTIIAKVWQLVAVLALIGVDRWSEPGVSTVLEWVIYILCFLALTGAIYWEAVAQTRPEQLSLGLIGAHLGVVVLLVSALALGAPGLLPGLQINLFSGWLCYVPAALLLFGGGVLCHAPVEKYLLASRKQLDDRLLVSLMSEALSTRPKTGEGS